LRLIAIVFCNSYNRERKTSRGIQRLSEAGLRDRIRKQGQ
jgi:hypothetical protein